MSSDSEEEEIAFRFSLVFDAGCSMEGRSSSDPEEMSITSGTEFAADCFLVSSV